MSLLRNAVFLGRLQRWVVDALLKFLKFLEDVAGIIKIAKSIEADGTEKKSSSLSQQSGLSRNMFQGKNERSFNHQTSTKGIPKVQTPYKVGKQGGKPSNIENKRGDIRNKQCYKCDKFGHF